MTPVLPQFTVTQNGTTLNVFHVSAGEGLPRHEHLFLHLTLCHAGSCIIRKEGRELVMTKDTQPVNLVAGEWHEIEALEDGTVFVNVFAEPQHSSDSIV
jgi:quercetin dioxygenase-like cupin family protein